MKNLFSILLLFVSTFGLTQNTLSFDNINVDQNTVFDLPIKIKNDNAFTAIQFDLNFNKDAFSLDSEHVLGSIAQSHTLSVSNPSNGKIKINYYNPEKMDKMVVRLFNSIGQLIWTSEDLNNNAGYSQEDFDLNPVTQGVYIITMEAVRAGEVKNRSYKRIIIE